MVILPPLSALTKAVITTGAMGTTAVLALVAGMSVEGFLALIVAVNGIELGFIVHNTERISRLRGAYDAEHD